MQQAVIKANLNLDYAGSEAFNTVCSNLTFSGKNIKKIVQDIVPTYKIGSN